MELKAKIIGVEEGFDGVVIVIQQEKMRIPIAEDYSKPVDIRKMMKMVFNEMQQHTGFRTGVWVAMEEYEQMGKPTVGDTVKIQIEKHAEPKCYVSKPITPFPLEQVVLFELKQLGGTTLIVQRQKLIETLLLKTKLTQKEIERVIKRMLRLGQIKEPEENYLKVA